jgi:predicted metalloprotease with PDZ domain
MSLGWERDETVLGGVRHDSPAEDAGLQKDDELLTIGGKKVSRENWLKLLARFKQGDRVPVTVRRDRKTINTTVILGQPDRFQYRIEEKKDATTEQRALRAAWLR